MNNPIPNNKITKTHIHLTSHKTHTIRLQQNNKTPYTKTPNKTNKIFLKKKCYKVQTTSRSKLDKLNKNKSEREELEEVPAVRSGLAAMNESRGKDLQRT